MALNSNARSPSRGSPATATPSSSRGSHFGFWRRGESSSSSSTSTSRWSRDTPKAAPQTNGQHKGPRRVAIAYLRNDLRIHDNASLYYAHNNENNPTHVLPLYVYDERQVECSGMPGYRRKGKEAKTRLCGFWRSGVFKTRFLTEAVYDLQHRLQDRNSGLLVRFGLPEEIVMNIVKALQARGDEVVAFEMQKEICAEELAVERKIKRGLAALGVTCVRLHQTKPLINQDDLPFPVSEVPDVFTPFRKRVEALGDKMIRKMFDMPDKFLPFPHSNHNPLGDDDNYGRQIESWSFERTIDRLFEPLKDSYEMKYAIPGVARHKDTAFPWAGGETAALERLEYYFLAGRPPPVANYKETRNMLLGHEYSTKMSPFLSIGCVSPRQITAALDEHEARYGSSQNTYWVRFELLWRDYFIYVSQKFGNALFQLEGYEGISDPKMAEKKVDEWNDWDPNNYRLKAWLRGRTGVPFIDANIIELRETGFMSNRGRQNVASFLTKDLYFDWRIGAEFFESHLIDYEPTANWGNWQYVAGVGNDPRASRQFNPIKQARDYDPAGDYVRTWISQLVNIPSAKVHTPWLLTDSEWNKYLTLQKNPNDRGSHGGNKEDRSASIGQRRAMSHNTSNQALSTEAVGRLGSSSRNNTRQQGWRPPLLGRQSGSDGDETTTSNSSASNVMHAGSSANGDSVGGSGSGEDQSSRIRPFSTRGTASESTGASSYTSSEIGGKAGESEAFLSLTQGVGNFQLASSGGRPDSQRAPSTIGSAHSYGSSSANLDEIDNASGRRNLQSDNNTSRSATALGVNLREQDDFMSETPYPRQPLFEQESWKPHYHRKDFGRKRGGPGGGNSRRLIRTPAAGKN